MQFQLLPILDLMLDFYRQPRGMERFREYLRLMMTDDGTDIELPLVAFNPMGKEHVLEKLSELQALGAERIMEEVIRQCNTRQSETTETIRTALIVADDSMGGWTNRYATDYQNTFNIGAMLKRRFCTPIFWTSEQYDEALIARRTHEQLLRTQYRMTHPQPVSLEDHVLQEVYVNRILIDHIPVGVESVETFHGTSLPIQHRRGMDAASLYTQNKHRTDYPFIFAFFYGDQAAEEFGLSSIGAEAFLGFRYAQWMAMHDSE